MFKSKKGFTLIELLVVIAIIGILSSVVLASLNTARSRGNNAKIKAQLAGARAAAELFYDANQTYTGVCTAGSTNPMDLYLLASNYPGSPTIACFGSGQSYSMSVPLSSSETSGGNTFNHWCVDNLGNSKGRSTAVTSAATTGCNQ